jgi:hypothetical protein
MDLLSGLLDAGAITLDSFTVTPPQPVHPCGAPPVTLSWRITKHPERVAGDRDLSAALARVVFVLNIGSVGFVVPAVGAHAFQPWTTTGAVLTAGLNAPNDRARAPLGSLTVNVTEAGCLSFAIPESLLQSMAQSAVQSFLNSIGNPNITLRAPVGISVSTNGIGLTIRLVYSSAVDVDIDIDANIILTVQNCQVSAMYSSFSLDADLPWWLDLVIPGIKEIIEAIIDDQLEGQLKPALLQAFQGFLNQQIQRLPANFCLCSMIPASHVINIVACPRTPIGGPPPTA